MTAQQNPFAYRKPITLDTLPDLFAHHARRSGGWRMEDEPPKDDDPPKGDPPKGDEPPKFEAITSQDDFDRRLSERLQRERGKFADYADLKKKAEAHDKALEAAKSDADKAIDAARKEGESAATERANTRLVGAEARALAAEAKFRNPALAVRTIDLADVKVNEDGEPDAEAIKTKLKELAESEPYLVDDGKNGKPKPDKSQGNSGSEPTPSLDRGRQLYKERHGKKTA